MDNDNLDLDEHNPNDKIMGCFFAIILFGLIMLVATAL